MGFLPAIKKQKTGQYDAVLVNDGHVSFARLNATGDKATLVAADYQDTGDDPHAALHSLIKHHHVKDNACATVLDVGDYQLLMVETPNVPQDELRAAVRWQIKDLIDFHIDDAVVDVFDAPQSPSRGQQQLYVVVTRQDHIQKLSAQLVEAGADLSVIDIPELVLRNLASLIPETSQGVALIYLGRHSGVIALCRDNILYLARTIELGYETLQESIANGQEYQLDNLALEIQRSLDYYDRYFQQAPITQLILLPPPVSLPGFHKAMQNNLGLESRTFPLRETLHIGDDVSDETLGHCALAFGAALRKDRKVL